MFKWNVIVRGMNGCRSCLTVTARTRTQAVWIAAKAIGTEIAELISVGIA